jgi:hypothetical protein
MWNLDYMDLSEEERRRRESLGPTRSEQEDSVTPVNTNASTPTVQVALSPSQSKYQAELNRMPNQGDYKPSKWRRFGAALAGGLAGLRNPSAGADIAQDIIDAPYANAVDQWHRSLTARAQEMGIEDKAMQQDIARRRAGIYEQQVANSGLSAQASFQRAMTDAEYKNFQMSQPRKYVPTTQDQYRADWQATEGQKLFGGFGSEEAYLRAHPKTDQAALQRMRSEARMAEIKYQEGQRNRRASERNKLLGQGRPVNPASPRDQIMAKNMAAEDVIRRFPQYADFYQRDPDNRLGMGRVKAPHEISGMEEKSGTLGFGRVGSQEAALRRAEYAEFLSEMSKVERNILGRRSPEGLDPNEDEFDDEELNDEEEQ